MKTSYFFFKVTLIFSYNVYKYLLWTNNQVKRTNKSCLFLSSTFSINCQMDNYKCQLFISQHFPKKSIDLTKLSLTLDPFQLNLYLMSHKTPNSARAIGSCLSSYYSEILRHSLLPRQDKRYQDHYFYFMESNREEGGSWVSQHR